MWAHQQATPEPSKVDSGDVAYEMYPQAMYFSPNTSPIAPYFMYAV